MTTNLKKLPKIERHIHFEGSLFSLVKGKEEIRSFYDFLEIYKKICFKIKKEKDFLYLSDEFFSYILSENIIYVEFFLSLPVWMKRGFDIFKILEYINSSGERYNKHFQYGIIIDGVRQFHPSYMFKLIPYFDVFREFKVVGFGIGGDENCCDFRRYYTFFELIRKNGFDINIHSGEAKNSKRAFSDVFLIRPDRIGHFLCLNDLNLGKFFLRDKVVVDYSLSSNLFTKVIGNLKEHPIYKIKSKGIKFLINSDDPAIFNTTLTKEYEFFLENGGTLEEIEKMLREEMNSIPSFKNVNF